MTYRMLVPAAAFLFMPACRIGYELIDFTSDDAGSAGGTLGNGGNAGAVGMSGGTSSGGVGGSSIGGTASGGSGPAGGTAGSGGSSGVGGSTLGSGGTMGTTGGTGGTDCSTTIATCHCETYGGHEYRFCTTPLRHSDSQAGCAASGMSLVRIDDAAEDTWVLDTAAAHGLLSLSDFPPTSFWIGASDAIQDGVWIWTDGEQFWSGGPSGTPVNGLYSNWDSNSPSDSGITDCGAVRSDGLWFTYSCTRQDEYVCESG